MLIESAWHYRYPAREGRALRERNARLPDHIRAIAWKAQTRLCTKFRRLAGTRHEREQIGLNTFGPLSIMS